MNYKKYVLAAQMLCMLVFENHLFSQQKLPAHLPLSLLSAADTAKKDTVPSLLLGPKASVKPYNQVVTKDFVTKTGLFTVHQSKDLVYFEIPDSLLHRDIMVINRLEKGPGGFDTYAGEELDEKTIQFEKGPDSSIRIIYDLVVNDADSSDAIYKAVENSSLNPTVVSLPIIAYGTKGGKSYVVDVSKFLKDKTFVNSISSRSSLSKGITSITMKDFYIESIHAYPVNVELSIRKNVDSKEDPMNPMQVTIVSHTSFIALPKVPMQRRFFDPRVGYFADSYYAFGDDQQKSELKKFILRWRLEPKDEDIAKWKRGELVDPKKPIVIYVDPATPKQWRPYLIAGINDWQKAFEKAGFKNAIIGKLWPENDTTMHMDDARYSMINYFPSMTENAYGPNVHDPRSGEIIQTHIGWYHNVMSLLHDWYMVQAGAVDPQARKPKFDDELMGQLIRFVSSHEVGHTLGLRHNFGSSSTTPVDSLRSRTYLEKHGHTASIMDYARFNYVAQPEDNIPQKDLFPRIGEYDRWAIEWGYKRSGAVSAQDDKKIASEWIVKETAKNPRLWFGDGETQKFDPRCQTEDLGDDAMKASTYGILNLKRILPQLPEWTHEEGGLYENLTEMYKAVQDQYFRYMGHVLRNVGGVEYTVKSEEQKGDVYAPTPIEKQKEALEFYNVQLFNTPYWLLDKTVMSKVAMPSSPNFVEDTQIKVLNSLLDKDRLGKILANNEQYADSALSLEAYVNIIHQGIWKELAGSDKIKIDAYRRNLQKSYLGAELTILSSKDPDQMENDMFSIMKADVFVLQQQIENAIPKAGDELTLFHLKDLQHRIKSLLNPQGMNL